MPMLATALGIRTALEDFKQALQQILSKQVLGGVCTQVAHGTSRAKGGWSEFPRVLTQLRAPGQPDTQPSRSPLRKCCCSALPMPCLQRGCVPVPYTGPGWFHICFHPGFVLISFKVWLQAALG